MNPHAREEHITINQTMWAMYYAAKDWLELRDKSLTIEEYKVIFDLILADESLFTQGRKLRNYMQELRKKYDATSIAR